MYIYIYIDYRLVHTYKRWYILSIIVSLFITSLSMVIIHVMIYHKWGSILNQLNSTYNWGTPTCSNLGTVGSVFITQVSVYLTAVNSTFCTWTFQRWRTRRTFYQFPIPWPNVTLINAKKYLIRNITRLSNSVVLEL